MDRLPIEQRLVHHFLAMGAQEMSSPEVRDPTTLSFQLGNDRLLVSVLTSKDLSRRNRIIETLLHASSVCTPGTRFYIAAPKLLGAALDAQIFRSHGIGLILFDERRIEQTIESQHDNEQVEPTPTLRSREFVPLSELATLKAMYAELERKMEQIMNEFRSLRENIPVTSSPLLENPEDATPLENVRQTPFSIDVPDNSLPSFFANNPWLDVLSKRGRREVTQYAG